MYRRLFSNVSRGSIRVYCNKTYRDSGIKEAYMSLVNRNSLQYDENQWRIIKVMSRVQDIIVSSPAVMTTNDNDESDTKSPIPRGLYVWGEVGTGKTMMMDMFYSTTPIEQKRRVHFHKFMLDVHKQIHEFKQELLRVYGRDIQINLSADRDPVLHAARSISSTAKLLCFDEFQVTDIADAVIMTKLFNELWRNGTVLVATSNRPPSDLYLGGINREFFMPFIGALESRCLIRELRSQTDYRQLMSSRSNEGYFTPLSEDSTTHLYNCFCRHSGDAQRIEIPVMMGRKMQVLAKGRVCWVTFREMCEDNKGAADYAALVEHMDVIYMDGIPTLSVLEHDKARRFITFIDEVYDAGKDLRWTSQSDPHQLFRFLTPEDEKSGSLGMDHSWVNRDVVIGESQSSVTTHGPSSVSANDKSFEYQKAPFDSISVSKYFKVPTTETRTGEESEREIELKMLEGELASIQELSFAFRRAASRMVEMSSVEYKNSLQRSLIE